MSFEFGYDGGKSGDASPTPPAGDVTDLGDDKIVNTVAGEPADDINDITDTSIVKPKPTSTGGDFGDPANPKPTDDDGKPGDNNDNAKPGNVELETGAVISVGEDNYTVAENGDVLDKDGNVFKEAKDVQEWMSEFDQIDDADKDSINITNIIDNVGVEIVDENNEPIVFENTPAGIKAYIDAVNEVNREEHQESAINALYQKYPIVGDVLNYYIANGNSLEGYNEVADRSNIEIDSTNESQHESIIRTAWSEQGRKGDVESYIQYLKSSGTLLPVAEEELQGIKERDLETKKAIADEAKEVEQSNLETLQDYWNGVQEVIKNKSIAGYKIPDTILINKDGKQLSATPNDFYNYVYQVDKDGKSNYEKDLSKETKESRRDDELLRAYLKFVGGNYSNLVGMAVNKDKVATLKLQARNRTTNSIKITKAGANKTKGNSNDFGYN